MLAQIKELYEVMNVAEDSAENAGQLDPYTLLFRSAKQKRKFQRNIKRFQKFLIAVVKTYLSLAKIHLSDDELIDAIGRREQWNIAELRNSTDKDFDITIEDQSDDVETKLGKQLVLNHVLQYVGPQLKPEDIGKLMRAMPYADVDESFDDFTLDFDSVTNEILALDRGEQPPVSQWDNHAYAGKRLLKRMREPDFKYLDPQIQMNYQQKLQVHQQIDGFQKMQIQRAEQGFIPTGGYSVGCDFYVEDPSDPTGVKTRRARIPYQAIEWLIKQLQTQGQGQAELAGMDQSMQAMYAQQVTSQPGFHPMTNNLPPSPGQGMGGAVPRPGPMMGAPRPMGPMPGRGMPTPGQPGMAVPGKMRS
jgi:hypothetical protein